MDDNSFFTIHTASGGRLNLGVSPGFTLLESLFAAGMAPNGAVCAGIGRCGRCRVRYLAPPPPTKAEKRFIPSDELNQGIRLACQRRPAPGDEIEVAWPGARESRPLTPELSQGTAVMAIDLGTTSIQWVTHDAGRELARGSGPNPQLGAGSEIMSRLAHARAGLADRLRESVLEDIRGFIESAGRGVGGLSIAGNPAMIHLLLGKEASGIARAPYHLEYKGGTVESLAEDLPPAYIAPFIGPFVGGDTTASVAAIAFGPEPPAYPYLLADLGTNGEFVLALDEESYLAASAPMGPSLEGVGLTHGDLAGPGVAVAFTAIPLGLAPRLYPSEEWEEGAPRAISGTGYVSLIAALARLGLVGEDGRFASPATPLAKRLADGIEQTSAGPSLPLRGGLALTAWDLEEVLKVKAAANTAVAALLARADISPAKLARVYLAGAFGSHADPADLARLGFLPPGCEGKTVAAGNTSLAGAEILGRDTENGKVRNFVERLAKTAQLVDLVDDPKFTAAYLKRMRFAYVA